MSTFLNRDQSAHGDYVPYQDAGLTLQVRVDD
jgi:hypothetical protein